MNAENNWWETEDSQIEREKILKQFQKGSILSDDGRELNGAIICKQQSDILKQSGISEDEYRNYFESEFPQIEQRYVNCHINGLFHTF